MPLEWSLELANTIILVLCDVLHWLSVSQRIIFKIAVIAFDRICCTGPAYFNVVCIPLLNIPEHAGLRSAECGDIPESATSTKIGSRSFRDAASAVWNSLLPRLHETTISRQQFKNWLNTHLTSYDISSENYFKRQLTYFFHPPPAAGKISQSVY